MKRNKYIVCEKCLLLSSVDNFKIHDRECYSRNGRFIKDGISWYCIDCFKEIQNESK